MVGPPAVLSWNTDESGGVGRLVLEPDESAAGGLTWNRSSVAGLSGYVLDTRGRKHGDVPGVQWVVEIEIVP